MITSADVGYAGPISLEILIDIDNEVFKLKNYIVETNKTNYHYKNVNLSDFKYDYVLDVRNISDDDVCSVCDNKLIFMYGSEVVNTFKLDTKYFESMGLYLEDKDNKLNSVYM